MCTNCAMLKVNVVVKSPPFALYLASFSYVSLWHFTMALLMVQCVEYPFVTVSTVESHYNESQGEGETFPYKRNSL